MKPSAYALPFWIGVFLFSIYLLSFSGKLHITDEFVGFAAGNNLVQHGRSDVNQFIWVRRWYASPSGVWGQDGNLYAKKAPGISLAVAPLAWLGHRIPGLNAVHLSLLTTTILTAITGSLLFIWLAELGLSRIVATFTALSYGLSTIAWVYARLIWEHAIMALLFLVAVWAIHRAIAENKWLWTLVCGIALAISLTMRFEAAFAVALFGLYIFYCANPLPQSISVKHLLLAIRDKKRWQWLGIYLGGPILSVIWLLYFNYARFGSISETGYNNEILFQPPWEGAYGLLFSPSTGLFIYAPLLVLLFLGLRPAWRRLPHPYFWLIITLSIFYWIFYGSWFSWGSTWVWGPRFLLHTLPLLMLFVAEAIEKLWNAHKTGSQSIFRYPALRLFGWVIIGGLTFAGIFINFLGVVVDLNEYFLRLGRNDNFLFNWQAFPPLGHWRILQEGLFDIIWLHSSPNGLVIEWPVVVPGLALLGISIFGLVTAFQQARNLEIGNNEKLDNHRSYRISSFILHPSSFVVVTFLTIVLVYLMMIATAQVTLAQEQAQRDVPVLETLAASARPDDALLVPMPPFGDVQEISIYIMAYLDQPIPTYAWIESEPRAIQPEERERLWQVMQTEASRVWLFERWLAHDDPLSPTAIHFNQEAFPIQEQWFEKSGKLTLYALSDSAQPIPTIPLNIPFVGGLTLVNFALLDDVAAPGDVVRVRLTWQASEFGEMATAGLPEARIVSFAHLLDADATQNIAQNDRLLLDLQNVEQSSLLPGQTVSQGYGLRLPDDLAPGSYPLITGLYSATSGQRLLRADDSPDDFLYLTNITVQ